MSGILASITEKSVETMSHTIDKNGLVEIIKPKDLEDEACAKYIIKNIIYSNQYDEISKEQESSKKSFKNLIEDYIKIYGNEFDLEDLYIRLTLKTKPEASFNRKLNLHGIRFTGHISLPLALQFFPDDTINEITKYLVYTLAKDYETMMSQILFDEFCVINPDGSSQVLSRDYIPEEAKYHIPLSKESILKIEENYENARKIYYRGIHSRRIVYLPK